jgi:hypothetical protein
VALILRNGGSQSPDRWLRELRNNQKVRLYLLKRINDLETELETFTI